MKIGSLVAQNDNKTNLHEALKWPLILPQIFGFFPINGVTGSSCYSLKFSWVSYKTIYTLITIFLVAFTLCCEIHKMLVFETNIFEINLLVFLMCGMASGVFSIKLAREWPHFMQQWHQMEQSMKNYAIDTNLKLKLNIIMIIIASVAAIEHILIQSYKLMNALKCSKTTHDGLRNFFVNASFSHVFDDLGLIEYSWWKGIIILNIQLTFSWTYTDVFIILISTAFAMRLKQINTKIEILLKSNVKTLIVWRSIRDEHYKLCQMCSILDDKISSFVLLSFFSNLYFILVQLFSSLMAMENNLQKAYYFISFGFLIARIVCVCLYGASINDESNKLMPILLSIPSHLCNPEIERLIGQITHTTVAISGRKFFIITRGLILKIAGAIVTYELVLIQFNQNLLHVDKNQIKNDSSRADNNSNWLC